MTTAVPQQTMPLNVADAIWALILTQSESVQENIESRFAALKEERRCKEIAAYEATLTPEEKAWAHDIADSVKRGLRDVKLMEEGKLEHPERIFSPARDFIKELEEEDLFVTCE